MPERDGEAELGADGAFGHERAAERRAQEVDDGVGHAARDRRAAVAHQAIGEHRARAPLGVEELRAARGDVDERELELEEAHRPQRTDALLVGGEAAPACPRAIARHEGDEERHQVERVDVMVIAHAIAEEEIDAGDAREEQRRARRDADDDERTHRQHRRLERGPAERRRHERVGQDGHVEARAEVAPHRRVLDVVQRLAEEEEAEHQADEPEPLHVAGFGEYGAQPSEHRASARGSRW